jgi:hypothetical protein
LTSSSARRRVGGGWVRPSRRPGHALGLSRETYDRLARGEASLPPACLPLLADLAGMSMATLLAELHGAPETAAALHTLVTAYTAIPTRIARDTLLTLAMAYSDS